MGPLGPWGTPPLTSVFFVFVFWPRLGSWDLSSPPRDGTPALGSETTGPPGNSHICVFRRVASPFGTSQSLLEMEQTLAQGVAREGSKERVHINNNNCYSEGVQTPGQALIQHISIFFCNAPNFTPGARAQRGGVTAQSHTARKVQSWDPSPERSESRG